MKGADEMDLEGSELEHIERLARVRVSEESRERLRVQLSRIIGFVRRLQEVDTSGYSPRLYVLEVAQNLREDEVGDCLERDEALAGSPDSDKGLFRVPPVIETDGT
ncbi:MAG: Asp-tRNA(Asn)/Glu-tRNA(Gln) amidotransferase subunit GatC [bacterium]|nr:MAG: Asp-tRNA(Asn)/Glu-tRNA(Gln) amidotransferase subunit GatC [bacterium]